MHPLLDLLMPSQCAGCGRAGRPVCDVCVQPLRAEPRVRWPTPAPAGLPPPHAVAAYDGSTRRLVVAYKDRDAVGARGPLAQALTAAVAAAAGGVARPLLVVPVPSSAPARRRRGYEPVADLARLATASLRQRGWPVRMVAMLEHARRVRDSAGLSAADRAANLDGALRARAAASRNRGSAVVLVDDVITTGVTLAEAARALRAAGIDVSAAALVAATTRRPGLHDPVPRH